MNESLITIDWALEDFHSTAHEIAYDEATDEAIFIAMTGLDEAAKYLISDAGISIFEEKDIKIIVDYIRELLAPRTSLDLKDVFRNLNWVRPVNGEFIVVIKINSFQSNHPLDPEEWDMNINFLGVLGKQVKLSYA